MKTTNLSLFVGKYLVDRISDILPVYAVIADHGAKYPFAVYRRTALLPRGSKDGGYFVDRATVQISIAADAYDQSVELANQVKERLEATRGALGKILVQRVDLVDAVEDWSNDAFIQTLTFDVSVTH